MTPPPPPPTLGPLRDGLLTGATWITLMGFVGVLALLALSAAPARAEGATRRVAGRLTGTALALGACALVAVVADLAHGLSESGGFDLAAARAAVYDGSADGLMLGLELTLLAVAVALTALAAITPRPVLTGAALALSAAALLTTRFPTEVRDSWGATIFNGAMWALHLLGGAIWVGGLIGLVALTGAVHGGRFWSRTIRRFSAVAMGCVAVLTLSGLWLFWKHVDGPSQLLSTLYGRVLGVKILIFGAMTLLGAANQFWLHPRIEALRAAGDQRPLRTLLVREFPAVVAIEVVLGMGVLTVAPFLHGSARTEVFQREHPQVVDGEYLKAPDKVVSGSTWVYGTTETVLVIAVMGVAYAASGRVARRRACT